MGYGLLKFRNLFEPWMRRWTSVVSAHLFQPDGFMLLVKHPTFGAVYFPFAANAYLFFFGFLFNYVHLANGFVCQLHGVCIGYAFKVKGLSFILHITRGIISTVPQVFNFFQSPVPGIG